MLTPAQLRAVYETALTRPGPTYFWQKGDAPSADGMAFSAAELAERDEQLHVQQALAEVQRAILEDAAVEHLRTESARLDAIRFHVGPKFWTSSYDRNALVDDIRALAAGEPVTAVAGSHYFDIEFEPDTDKDKADLRATESLICLADALDTLFRKGASDVLFDDGATAQTTDGRVTDVPDITFSAAEINVWAAAARDGHPRFDRASSTSDPYFNSFDHRARATFVSDFEGEPRVVFRKVRLDEPRDALIIGLSPITDEAPDEN